MQRDKFEIELKDYFYRAQRGVTINKEVIPKDVLILLKSLKEDNQSDISFFCDLLYPRLPSNKDDIIKNYLIKLRIIDLNMIIEVPLTSIQSMWIAGWPRAGYMVEKWIDFPWRLLKPLDQFIKHQTSHASFIQAINQKPYDDGLRITKMYFKYLPELLKQIPSIEEKDQFSTAWLNEMNQFYNNLLACHNEDIKELFSISKSAKPYTGLIINIKSLSDDQYDYPHNPFIKKVWACMLTSNNYFVAQT